MVCNNPSHLSGVRSALNVVAFLAPCLALLLTPAADAFAKKGKDGGDDAVGADKVGVPMEVQGRLYGLWSFTDSDEDKPSNEFSLERARLEFTFIPIKWLEGTLETAFDDTGDGNDPSGMLRDAFVLIKPQKWLKVRMGQFKKPFSLMELKSKGKMTVVTRGISNDYLVRELGYGGRDIGLQFDGRLVSSLKLDYSIGVFNGGGSNVEELDANGAKDVAARLEAEFADWLDAGVNGSLKNFDRSAPDNDDKPAYSWMAGGDLQLRLGKLRVQAEGMYGVNHSYSGHPTAASTHVQATWKFKLPGTCGMSLQPVARFDMMWPLLSESSDKAWLATLGVNWQISENLRLMVDAEMTRADTGLATEWADQQQVLVQLALDL